MAALTDGFMPEPTQANPTPPYSPPTHADLAAVAATVSIVGVIMAILITWLVLRLRHAACTQPDQIPIQPRRPTSYPSRPSLAPSEASSKFGFIRKPLRLSHRQQGGSWDFADPDPLPHQKLESPLSPPPARSPSQKHRPAPLMVTPAYTPRARRTSTLKDELGPRTPTTPATPLETPPPAYCREASQWPVYKPKDLPSP